LENIFHIDPNLEIPVYQQLADSIRVAIKREILKPNQQLPTVQALSEELSIARGTIKRAYDELEREEFIQKTQGRGTFVRYQPQYSESRKDRAMAAIDGLMSQLKGMGLSSSEISIFITLKLRELEAAQTKIKIAVVECNPENLTKMAEQLHSIKNTDIYTFLLDSIQRYPYQLEDDFDLIVTTAEHADFLTRSITAPKKVVQVAMRLATPCLSALIRLKPGTKIGIVGQSQRFCQLLATACRQYAEDVTVLAPQLLTSAQEMTAYLQGLDGILLPENYEKFCLPETLQVLNAYPGQKITCCYKMDEGSKLYLNSKIRHIQEKKA